MQILKRAVVFGLGFAMVGSTLLGGGEAHAGKFAKAVGVIAIGAAATVGWHAYQGHGHAAPPSAIPPSNQPHVTPAQPGGGKHAQPGGKQATPAQPGGGKQATPAQPDKNDSPGAKGKKSKIYFTAADSVRGNH